MELVFIILSIGLVFYMNKDCISEKQKQKIRREIVKICIKYEKEIEKLKKENKRLADLIEKQ